MKYCKKCFRNVDSENLVCPYCGNTSLTVYRDEEGFECTEVEPKIEDENYSKSADSDGAYDDTRLSSGSVFSIFEDMDREKEPPKAEKEFCACLDQTDDDIALKDNTKKDVVDDVLEKNQKAYTVSETEKIDEGEPYIETKNGGFGANDIAKLKKVAILFGIIMLFISPPVGIVILVLIFQGGKKYGQRGL